MKFNAPTSRLAMLGLMGLLMAAAIAFVVLRSGPLALVRVTVAQATQGSITPALFGIDTVEVRRSYLVGPTAAGRVLRVLVDAGDSVKAGQLLAEMDPVDLDHRLAALDASVARAVSAIAAADAQKVDMAARRELAAITTRRYADLGRQNFVSASAVEAKLQEQTSADAGARAAQANLAGAQQDLARLKGERAALVQQRQNARLVAASDSIVLSRDAEPGSTVVAGQAVLRLIEPGSLWVKARFDQGRSAGLVNGLAADIVLRASADRTTPGKVLRMELQGDSVTEDRVAQIAVGALPPRYFGGRIGRGHVAPAGHRAGAVAAQCRHQAPPRPDRRLEVGRWPRCFRRAASGSVQPGWPGTGAGGHRGGRPCGGLQRKRDRRQQPHPGGGTAGTGCAMISLAGRDILHSWSKFVFTGIGLGLLIGVTLTMAGV